MRMLRPTFMEHLGRHHWVLVLGLSAVPAAGLGCGARTALSPEEEEEVLVEEPKDAGDGGKTATGPGVCILCDSQTMECGYCLIRGHVPTYVCPPGVSPPISKPMTLGEHYRNDTGWRYTCFYGR